MSNEAFMSKPAKSVDIHIGLPIAILTSIGMHLSLGLCILIRNANSTLLTLSGLDKFSGFFGFLPDELGIFLVILGLMALLGICLENRISIRICTMLVFPQYGLMLWSLVSSSLIVIDAHNPSTGQPLDRSLIITVLLPITWISIGHTVAFWERYISRWSK